MKSLHKTAKICSVIVCLCFMATQTCPILAQDENPFDNKTKNADQNPFGNSTHNTDENPFADLRASTKNQIDPNRARNEREEIRVLKQNFQLQMAVVSRENVNLKQKIAFYETKEKSISKWYRSLIEKMLNSKDATVQLFALKALQETRLEGPLGQLGPTVSESIPKSRKGILRLLNHGQLGPTVSESTVQLLVKLTESESAEIKRLAVQWLLDNNSTEATNLGYQRPGPWYAASLDAKTLEIRRALLEPSSFDVEETELQELLEPIQEYYGINVIFEKSVNVETAVTYRSSGLKLGNALKGLLSKYSLEYQIYDQKLAIVPRGHPEPKTSLIYQVKGLVDGNLAIDKITSVVEEMIAEQNLDGKISVIDENRFTVSAAESVQAKVAEILGQLATYR